MMCLRAMLRCGVDCTYVRVSGFCWEFMYSMLCAVRWCGVVRCGVVCCGMVWCTYILEIGFSNESMYMLWGVVCCGLI
jgi:hypothetical protein